jgi:hypothetical protein
VTIDTPSSKDALGVAILTRTPNMVHDLIVPSFLNGFANPAGDIV